MSDEELAALAGWRDTAFFSAPERAALAFMEEMQALSVSDAVTEELARHFNEAERVELGKQLLQHQRAWLGGRIAAKDAVRELLFRLGHGPIFPAEITIEERPNGPAIATAPGTQGVRVWLAQDGRVSVAVADEGSRVGLDVRRVDTPTTAAVSPSEAELRVVAGEPVAEGETRLAGAKAAAARAGVESPVVRDRAGDRMLVGETWVETRRRGDLFISWTRSGDGKTKNGRP